MKISEWGYLYQSDIYGDDVARIFIFLRTLHNLIMSPSPSTELLKAIETNVIRKEQYLTE